MTILAKPHRTNQDDTAALDLINQLAGIAPDSALAHARQIRLDATEHTQLTDQTLFAAQPDSVLTLPLKYFLAHEAALFAQNEPLSAHYHALMAPHQIDPQTPLIQSALAYLHTISLQPNQANKAKTDALVAAGWSPADIVLLAQLITYVAYQARLVTGLTLLQSTLTQAPLADPEPTQPIKANHWHQHPTTAAGTPAPTAFTLAQLDWEPWLPTRTAASLSETAAASMKKFGQISSDYFLLLAHQSTLLHSRTLIDRSVFYTPDGLPRWARELAAVVVSKTNGCIYCASVHARKAIQYGKDRQLDVQRLLNTPAEQVLATGYDDYLNALIDFSASLSATPIQANAAQVQRLRDLGLTELALLDLVQSTAFFAWANRLMLSLGEAALPAQTLEQA
ncbi:MAG: peroxidase-related enzyme [Neisseriaceae bacterium]|nr:peroxidase-related enzyme [Neisseriaceae bacterium]